MEFDPLAGLNNIPGWLWTVIVGVFVFIYLRSKKKP